MKNKVLKKVIALATTTAMVMGLAVTAQAADYPDVTGGWFYDSVQWVSDNGIMTGYENGKFGPSDLLTRGQFATVLYRAEGSPETAFEWGVYPDVVEGKFYSVPAIWGKSTGVITGYDNGNFGYADNITREQLVTMLYRYSKEKGIDVSGQGNIYDYPDGGKVSSFAKEAIAWSLAAGIIKGDQGNINPQGNANRAVCATILQRYFDPDASTPEEGEYSYDVEVLNKYGLYSRQVIYLYVKTDNPDPTSFEIKYNGGKPMAYPTGAGQYADVSYPADMSDTWKGNILPASEGYLFIELLPAVLGTDVLEIVEKDSGKSVYSTTAGVKDYDVAEKEWCTSVIDEVTNDSMTGQEKMDAIANYIVANFKQSPKDSDGNDIELISHDGAFWETKELTPYMAKYIMERFANYLGIKADDYTYDAYPTTENILTEWDYVI